MRTKAAVIGLCLCGIASGYALAHPLVFDICRRIYTFGSRTGCSDNTIGAIGNPLLVFSLWMLGASFISSFLKKKAYRTWLKFAGIGVLLSLFFVAVTPTHSPYLFDFFPFYRTDAARVAGMLFTIGTIVVVGWKYWTLRRAGKKASAGV